MKPRPSQQATGEEGDDGDEAMKKCGQQVAPPAKKAMKATRRNAMKKCGQQVAPTASGSDEAEGHEEVRTAMRRKAMKKCGQQVAAPARKARKAMKK